MTSYKIDVHSFFYDHRKFPWDILGYGVPKYGQPHSYVCSMLAPLSHRIEKPLLAGGASLREVGRLAQVIKDAVNEGTLQQADYEPPFVTGEIFKYFTTIYDQDKSDRNDTAQEVLNCLRGFESYKEWMLERLTYLWQQGLIVIPKEHLIAIVEKKEESYKPQPW